MNAREAIRLKFTHPDSDKPPTTESVGWCSGIMAQDGSRCEESWRDLVYGFRFCRRHGDAASKWVSKTSLEGKEPVK